MEDPSSLAPEQELLLALLRRDLLGTNLPRGVSEAAGADPRIGALAARVRRRLFTGGGPPGMAWAARFHLGARDGLPDVAAYCLRRAAVPTVEDWSACPLPDALRFLYCAVRPLRLAGLVPPRPWLLPAEGQPAAPGGAKGGPGPAAPG